MQRILDGNFKAKQLKMRNPEDDVELTNGTGFMTQEMEYVAHLKIAKDSTQVSQSLNI